MPSSLPEHDALSPGLKALLTWAGFGLVPDTACIGVTGTDAERWLNGITTNSIVALGENETCYTFFLNAQGRIQGDAVVARLTDSFRLFTAASRAESLIAMLDRFIIMDDVELHRLPDDNPIL